MAKITRVTQPIFAGSATNNGVFGSAQDGSKILSNNLATLMEKPAWATGWLNAVIGASKFPPLEEFQALSYIQTTQLAYIFQEGIPEYDSGTTYYTNSIVKKSGSYQLYGSVTNANLGNPLTDPTNWTLLIDLGAVAAPVVFVGGTTGGSANAQILASLMPAGFSLTNGYTIICTAGFTNTGSATLAITSPSISATTIKKDSGSGLINLAAGDITAGDTLYLTYNSGGSCFVLTAGLALGALAYLNVGIGLASSGGNLNLSMSPNSNTMTNDVALNNTAAFFDGPTVSQGTSGTWKVSGTVTLTDTASPALFAVKLWDGTTVIASTYVQTVNSAEYVSASLSGIINSPAGNLRISVKDVTATTGKILYNQSGAAADSTISAFRIG